MFLIPKASLKGYTFLLLITALLGVHFFSVTLGGIQLTPYRVLLILAPFMFVKVKGSVIMKLKQSPNYSYFAFILFWVCYSFASLILVEDFVAWGKMYIFLFSGFITTWYIGLFFTNKHDVVNALRVLEFVSFLYAIIAFYEIFTGNYLFYNRSLEFYQERSAIYSTIGFRVPIGVFSNPNNYSLFLIFSVFFSLALLKVKNSKIGRFISLILAFVFLFLIIATQSRSGFYGLVLGLTAYGIIELIRNGSSNFTNVILISVGAVFFVVPWLSDNRELYENLMEVDFSGSSGSDGIRINLIKNGFHFLINSVFLGVGLGNIEYHMSHNAVYQTGDITNIHNWWMEILVSSGIFVFVYYFSVYMNTIKRLFKFSLRNQDKDLKYLSSVFFALLVSFFVASVGSSSLMYNEWIWPLIAVVMSFVNLNISRPKGI